MRTNHPSPAQLARLSSSHSNVDIKNIDTHNTPQEDSRLARSSSMVLPPEAVSHPYWHDQSVEPRIFPGLVHERTRTRTGSLKRESGSEQDFDPLAGGGSSSSSGTGWQRGNLEKLDKGSKKAMFGKSDEGSRDGDTQ